MHKQGLEDPSCYVCMALSGHRININAKQGKGEYFRDTILDALLFEGETILEC